MNRYYLALVRGHISSQKLTLTEAIGDDLREMQSSRRMSIASSPFCSKATRDALTHLVVLERGLCYGYPATKILLRPITGRRHQLRLHCSSIGHTIVGDYTYSERKDVQPYRMFLHAFKLVLPSKVEHIVVTTEDPFGSEDDRNSWIPCETITTIPTAILISDKMAEGDNSQTQLPNNQVVACGN
jgi:23S rRNA-/tRNA-specific pseudouridylate synthase